MTGIEILEALSAELVAETNRELQNLAKAPSDQYAAQKATTRTLTCMAAAVVRAKHRLEKASAVKASAAATGS